MKRIRIISFVLLAVLLATTLTGCGEEKTIGPEVGKWHGELSISDLSGSLSDEDRLLLNMIAGDVFYEIDVEFFEDGTFTYNMNTDKLKESVSDSVSTLISFFISIDVSLFTDRLVEAAIKDVLGGTKQFYSGKYTKSETGIITATDEINILFELDSNLLTQIDSSGNAQLSFTKVS